MQDQGRADFDIMIVAQTGRLTYEAVLFAASLRASAPGFTGTLYIAEPQPGALWPRDPRVRDKDARALLEDLGAVFLPFENRHFGARYPHGNKVEALAAMPEGRPFVFFDTDTLVTGPLDAVPFDFNRPSASMQRTNTWPEETLYGPSRGEIWRALYDRFDIPFAPTLDEAHPDGHWEHYLYFNAGWFFGPCPRRFHASMIEIMTAVESGDIPELVGQTFDPWLDQVALPLTIARLGGGRPGTDLAGLDGDITTHWRALPLLYAKASPRTLAVLEAVTRPNKVKKVLKTYEPFKRMIYQRRGDRVRALFDQSNLPKREKVLRNRIKRQNLWMR